MEKLTIAKLRQAQAMLGSNDMEYFIWTPECDEIDRAIIYALDGIKVA